MKLALLVPLALLIAVAACGDDDEAPLDNSTDTPGAPSSQTPGSNSGDALDASQTLPTADDVSAYVDDLALDIGERPAGSKQEQAAADYLQDQLESFGYTVEQQSFDISSAFNDRSTVEAEGEQFPAYAAQGSAMGEVEAPLFFAGFGHPEDLSRDAAGAIVIEQRGEIPLSQKVSNAQEAGARALIIYNNEPGFFAGTLSGQRADIPVVVVSGLDGGALKDAAEAGESGRVSATVTEASESQNVIARADEGPCRIVIGGHYDTVTGVQGALDNASGTAAFLEVAQTLAARNLTRGICIVGFGAEEIGLLGSTYFVEQLDEEERSALLGMINLDVVGFGEELALAGSRALSDLALEVAAGQGIEIERQELPPGASSDHASFLNAGLPAVAFFTAEVGPIHTPEDTVDQVNDFTVASVVLLALATTEALVESI
jgi:aminopeptidase YwaD